MAYFSFTKAILEGKPTRLFNVGKMKRDFTYVDDIVEGVVRIMSKPAKPDQDWSGDTPDPSGSSAPYRIYNIGNNNPVELGRFVEILEECLGRKAIKEFHPLQQGDVVETFADIDSLFQAVDFRPKTSLEEGLGKFVEWHNNYYGEHKDENQ
jgi:UDP-glucuronate 4-epimerase